MPLSRCIVVLVLFYFFCLSTAFAKAQRELKIQAGNFEHALILSPTELVLKSQGASAVKIPLGSCNKSYLTSFFESSVNGFPRRRYEIISSRKKRLTKFDIETQIDGKKAFWGYNSSTGSKLRKIPVEIEKAKTIAKSLCAGASK